MSKLRIYRIAENYVRYLHAVDGRVQYNKGGRPYVGVVLTVEGFRYFVPLESPKPNHANIKGGPILKLSNGMLGIMGFNNMIPVPEAELLAFDIAAEPDEKYRALLYNQLSWCNKIAEQIAHKAKKVYINETSGAVESYKRICCDFKALEAACLRYGK